MRTPDGYKPSKIKKIISYIFTSFVAIGAVLAFFEPTPLPEDKTKKVNKQPNKISNKSINNGNSKGFLEDATLEDFLFHINNWIKDDPENPENYGNRGLIYFNLKKYQSALKDLNKSIKMSDYIDEEIYLARGLIYLKKSKKSRDLFEKKGCKDIKIVFESDNEYQANTLKKELISAARKKCKI